MAEDRTSVKVGDACYDAQRGCFVEITGEAISGMYSARVPGKSPYETPRGTLVPVPAWVYELRAHFNLLNSIHGARAEPVFASGEASRIEHRDPLVDLANSLNQGVRITIEALYDPEAAPCDEPC